MRRKKRTWHGAPSAPPGDRSRRICAALLDAIPVAVLVQDAQLRPVSANGAFLELAQSGALEPEHVRGLGAVAPELWEMVLELGRAALSRSSEVTREVRLPTASGQERSFQAHVSPAAPEKGEQLVVSVLVELSGQPGARAEPRPSNDRALDILREEASWLGLEVALIRSERMAAVGTLAGGVAHQFNNINTAVLGFAELAKSQSRLDSTTRAYLERITKAALRAKCVTDKLLQFSGQHHQPPSDIANLSQLVADSVELVANEFEVKGITVKPDLAIVPDTAMNRAQLGHVLLSLLVNARDAMQFSERKLLTVTTGADEANVWVRVTDTGCGVAPAQMRNLFTPFFSTKGEHAPRNSPFATLTGTGLGLSVSHSIVASHGGRITVSSEPAKGSTFTVYVPIRMHVAAQDEQATKRTHGHRATSRRVLVLDDEPEIREFVVACLQMEGFEALATDDGKEALQWLADGNVDLVLVDLQMPKMSGVEFLNQARTLPRDRRPARIVMTGRLVGLEPEDFSTLEIGATIVKPFGVDELRQKVRDAMAAAS